MSVEPFRLRVPQEASGERLDRFLAAELPTISPRPVSRREVRRLISAGAVYVDGGRVQVQSRKLRPGAEVKVLLETSAPKPMAQAFNLQHEQVLYEDEHLLALNKPTGLPVQATREDAVRHLFKAAQTWLSRRSGRPTEYLALHHRLDRGTSGVVLLSKSKAANAGLAASFAERRVEKLYLALVHCEETPPPEWTVEDHLTVVESDGKRLTESVLEGGREATTTFRLRRPLGQGLAFVEAVPKTGRTHQVRVHLANSGLPVFGDRLYGPHRPELRAPRLMLHAHILQVDHPVRRDVLRLESPVPEDFKPWLNIP